MPLNADISPQTQKPCAIEVLDTRHATTYLLERGIPEDLAKKIVEYDLTGGQLLFLKKAVEHYRKYKTPRERSLKEETLLWEETCLATTSFQSWRELSDAHKVFEHYKKTLHDLYVDPIVVQINLCESAQQVKDMFLRNNNRYLVYS